jgi:hypothetical protein
MGTGRQGSDRVGGPPSAHPVGRPWLVAILASAVIAIQTTWWSAATGRGAIGDLRILERPVGAPVVLSLYPVTALPGGDRYVVGRRSQRFTVVGDPAGLTIGDDVTLHGTVGDGVIVETSRAVAAGRPAKRRLGLVGLGVTGLALATGGAFTRRGWRPRWPTS